MRIPVAVALCAWPLPGQEEAPSARELRRATAEVRAEVEELRGWSFRTPVDEAVRSPLELREYLEELLREEYGDGGFGRKEAWLRLLGLLPPDVDLRRTMTRVLLSQVGGFYDAREDAFFLVEDLAAEKEPLVRMVIAHELTHALDDQHVDLDALMHGPEGERLDEDRTFAIRAVIEGSATALTEVWSERAVREGRLEPGDLAVEGRRWTEAHRVLVESPRYFGLLVGAYTVGLRFIRTPEEEGRGEAIRSGAAIRAVAADPPRSSEQVLHPRKYWDPDHRDEPVVLAAEEELVTAVEKATGRDVVTRETLGEAVAALVASRPGRPHRLPGMARPDDWTHDAARGWGGDRLLLLGRRRADGSPDLSDAGVLWFTFWDGEEDQREFAVALARYRGEEPGFDHATHGRGALFAFGAARRLQEPALRALLERVRCRKDGQPWPLVP